ncbi:hypothetical protein PHLCEN_2v1775 [Hermanssonia centrifuga]|uniref:NmrA-like domain-containing protein n=1 Tax=Hermanssonia centrifuga TaxID=98765 RepID=A0A2R6RVU6_9APHY|nr:hypothetical protein PHLCEN_2v1775 [Hermanssonia centrifuga]
MTILITGAAGRTSGYVIRTLLNGGTQPDVLRLFVRSEAAVEKLQAEFPQLPRSSFAIGDYFDPKSLSIAFQGVDIVFYNGPAFQPLETAMGIAAIEASQRAAVMHFVYCSVLLPGLRKLSNHELKLGVEEYLAESGLNFTILQPTAYMQNFKVKDIAAKSVLAWGASPKTVQSFIDLQDLADIARLVILDPAPHNYARYDVVGDRRSLEDIASIITRRASLSAAVVCQQLPREQVAAMATKGQGAYAQEAMNMLLYYWDKRGIPGNNNTVRWLLGREPVGWETFVDRELGNK